MNKFQITYFIAFIISVMGIAGNMDLCIETPLHCWIIQLYQDFWQ